MKTPITLKGCLLAAAATTLLQGCVGYNRVAFVTKSNVGLDADTQPVPTLQVNISRKELAIEPTFEGGQTPPLLASFGGSQSKNAGERFGFGVNQTFSGGDAAIVLAQELNRSTVGTNATERTTSLSNYDSSISISKLPEANMFQTKIKVMPYEAGKVTPFVFATDTGLGVKVNWTGTTGEIPDAVHIGFRRKEGAVAPVFATQTNGANNTTGYLVKIPSFLATVDNDVKVEKTDTKTGTLQFFATGRAATYLAMHQQVREAMIKRLDSTISTTNRIGTTNNVTGVATNGTASPIK